MMAPPTVALISRCLARAAEERPTAAEMWAQPFFAQPLPPTYADDGLERDAVLHKRVPPPWVPKLRGPLDTAHFRKDDEDEEDEDEDEDEEGGAPSVWVPPCKCADAAHELHLCPPARLLRDYRTQPCASVDELLSAGEVRDANAGGGCVGT
jgi:hypothetical protein